MTALLIPAAKIKILKDFGLIPASETLGDQQINLQGRNKSGNVHINEINLLKQPESHLTKNEQKKQSTQKRNKKQQEI
ncbi:hypothetical protein MSSIT_1123 [Methanosarcina siciliae T4/M]|uniref:Uncharacterized protein n=2 Tax=Methanosarcina siciliae TaxID=38027 RepID=A0A0E3LAC2_9EURY|nr:hypothetical protein MSSIT_1123 [Methanosarcina siciliae T4/M]AKB31766.1 hypothetical protein MSSIH_1076 [Methanosarcina siciliae HI350]